MFVFALCFRSIDTWSALILCVNICDGAAYRHYMVSYFYIVGTIHHIT